MPYEQDLNALGASARALFTDEQLSAFEEAFDQQAAYCRGKTYSEEGIPMFLVLEDVSGPVGKVPGPTRPENCAPRDALFDLLIVTALELYKHQLERKGEPLQVEHISMMLEVLGEHFFTTAQPPKLKQAQW